jgi:1-acyl-sn-glycerol-3-phosphate acyltransferase
MRAFLSGALNLLRWSFIGAWTVLWTSVAMLLVGVTRRPGIGLAMARRIWAPGAQFATRTRVVAEGAERLTRDRAWFIACNHSSFADIPILFTALPVDLRFVAKQQLRRVPFMGWYMAAMGMVFVDRERRSSAAAGIDAVATVLRQGGAVLSFPAGTRRRPGEPQRFKSAAFAPALLTGTPVVPVAVRGTADRLPPGGRFHPGTCRVRVGEPIPTAGLPVDARDELARRAEAAVEALLAELDRTEAG